MVSQSFLFTEDKILDKLYNAAINYKNLYNIAYKVKLGRKGKTYNFILHFPPESFFHLVGMQHLVDLTFSSKNKERIFKDILKHDIDMEFLKKSFYYDKWHIDDRIDNLYLLETMLEGQDSLTYKINQNDYKRFSTITADYLIQYTCENIFYLFVVKQKESDDTFDDEHRACSFFKKYDKDYTQHTMKSTLLTLSKISNFRDQDQIEEEIYRNPAYKEC